VTAFFGAAIGFHLYRGLKILSYADVEVAVRMLFCNAKVWHKFGHCQRKVAAVNSRNSVENE